MSIILQGMAGGGLITQGYDIAAVPLYPPIESVAAGVVYGPNGALLGKMTYAGFAATGDSVPEVPVGRRRSTPFRTLDKRVSDIRLYDIDLTPLLDDSEQILYVKSITCRECGTLGFGQAYINPAPIYYKLLDMTCDIGKVVQVQMQGGELPYGMDELMCTIRLVVVTNENPAVEAVFCLRLTDGPT